MQPFFSIIMPVHDCAKYLPKAIDSVRSQTFSEWQLLIADDGSTDGSGSLAEQMAASDPRIQVRRLAQRGGAAQARNAVLPLVTGRYLTFLDADDYWSLDVLAQAKSKLAGSQIQVLKYGLEEVYLDREEKILGTKQILTEKMHLRTAADIRLAILRLEQYPLFGYLCNSFYDYDFWQKNNFSFCDDYKTQEDFYFNLKFFSLVTDFYFLSYAGYHYCKRPGASLSACPDDDFYRLRMQKIALLGQKYEAWHLWTEAVQQEVFWLYVRYVYGWLTTKKDPAAFAALWRQLTDDALYQEFKKVSFKKAPLKQRLLAGILRRGQLQTLRTFCGLIALCRQRCSYLFALVKG